MTGDEHGACCDAVHGPDPGICDRQPSRVAGAIGRGVVDAAEGGIWAAYGRYQVRLEELRGGPTVQG